MYCVIQNVVKPQGLKSWLIWRLWKFSVEKISALDKIKCKHICRGTLTHCRVTTWLGRLCTAQFLQGAIHIVT